MRLDKDWKDIVKKAWSIRLILLAGVLSGAEVILPLFQDAFPRGIFAVLSMITIALAFWARITVQKDLEK